MKIHIVSTNLAANKTSVVIKVSAVTKTHIRTKVHFVSLQIPHPHSKVSLSQLFICRETSFTAPEHRCTD